ncbi:MAG TPA: endonuclease domain-containing protein [Alphaproteobacteria bacterium]|nr:endonuclease domain-containing protein [Alphaproteobacteria bacterium]
MIKKVVVEAINPVHGNINYIKDLTPMARINRRNPTIAEEIIWHKVLRYRKTGFKFTRQKPINRFILDFYCSELNLAIEIDGDSHNKKKGTDKMRDEFLYKIGIQTIRFTNEEIMNNLNRVQKEILDVCSRLALSRGGTRF